MHDYKGHSSTQSTDFTSLEALMKEYMARQSVSLRALENQVEQLGNALSSRQQWVLPSNTENPKLHEKPPRNEYCKAIIAGSDLRIGKPIEDPKKTIDDPKKTIDEEATKYDKVNAEVVPKATKVDGVYDDGPRCNPNARLHDNQLIMKRHLKISVMDMTTIITLCQENNIPGMFKLL
ncbi:uridylate kinase-like [Hibiscus syriacus]|uniref:uridylate kinase-like n=1 Tax=Hibiscus syriacus TaxID=106335 RepID=UPI001922DAF9|nr:uridylate kinase-like [Hibiscus syriacus]